MSGSDKKAVKAIIILGALVGDGHFGIYRQEVIHHLNILTNLYYPENCGSNEYYELNKDIQKANKELCKLGKSTITMMMNSILAIADKFAICCKGERKRAWEDFIEFAQSNELFVNSAKNPEIQFEMADKGALIEEIIFNY